MIIMQYLIPPMVENPLQINLRLVFFIDLAMLIVIMGGKISNPL
jgi:hypothetical protein